MGNLFLRKWVAGVLLATGGLLLARETAAASETPKRIVILGDSITAGYGLDPSEAYPALLQRKIEAAKLPYTVTNAGVSGDTTAGGLRRITWAMGKGADVLVIALGGNDGLRGISPEETKKNLLGIITKARANNPAIKVLIVGMQMPDSMGLDFTTRFKAIYPEAAKQAQAAFIPFLLDGVGGIEKFNQADGIHPTPEGQTKIAATVWQTLEPALTQ